MEIPDSYYSKDEYVETVITIYNCINCTRSTSCLQLNDLISFTCRCPFLFTGLGQQSVSQDCALRLTEYCTQWQSDCAEWSHNTWRSGECPLWTILCYWQELCDTSALQTVQQRHRLLSHAHWRSCLHRRGRRGGRSSNWFVCVHWQECHNSEYRKPAIQITVVMFIFILGSPLHAQGLLHHRRRRRAAARDNCGQLHALHGQRHHRRCPGKSVFRACRHAG